MTEQEPQAATPSRRPSTAPGVRAAAPTTPARTAAHAEDDTPTSLIPAVSAGSSSAGSGSDSEDTVIGPAVPVAPFNGAAPRPRNPPVNGSAPRASAPRAQAAVPAPLAAPTAAPEPVVEPSVQDDEVAMAEQAGLSARLRRTARKRVASPTAPLADSDTVTEPSIEPVPQRHLDPPTAGRIAPDADTTAAPATAATAVAAAPPPDRATSSAPAATKAPSKASPKTVVRKAHLRLVSVDPWSVTKIAFALSLALAIVTVVAITIVWTVLGAAGVWDAVNSSVATVMSDNADSFDITKYVGFERIIGLTIVVAAADVLLITALAPVAAFLYNLASSLLGGLEVTLAEDN